MLLAETKASNIIRQQQRNVHAKQERKQFTTYLHKTSQWDTNLYEFLHE